MKLNCIYILYYFPSKTYHTYISIYHGMNFYSSSMEVIKVIINVDLFIKINIKCTLILNLFITFPLR